MIALKKVYSPRQYPIREQGGVLDWIDHKRFFNMLIKINEAHVILDGEGSILQSNELKKAVDKAITYLKDTDKAYICRTIDHHLCYGSVSEVIEASALLLLAIRGGYLKNSDLVYHALISLLPKRKVAEKRIDQIAKLDLRGRLAFELAHELLSNSNLLKPVESKQTNIANYPIKYLIMLGGYHLVNACNLLLTGAKETIYPLKTKHLDSAIEAISNESNFPELQKLLPDLEKLHQRTNSESYYFNV